MFGTRATTLLGALLLVLLCACSRERAAGTTAPARDPGASSRAREGVLDLLAPATPVAPGSRDWVPAFEAASGCRLRVRNAASSAELLTLIESVDSDVVLAGGDVAASLVEAGQVSALPEKRLGDLGALPKRLRELPGARAGGVSYGLPVRWQANVLVYDASVYTEPPTSWSVLYAPPAERAQAPALAAAEPVAIADAALYLASARPELGIVDPFALDERQYAAAVALLRQRQPQWRGRGEDLAHLAEAQRNGVAAFVGTPAQARALQAQGVPVAWARPAEGVTAQVELAMLRTQARHPDCANFFLAWALSPGGQAMLAARVGALPARADACKMAALGEACALDRYDTLATAHFWQVPQARCGSRRCVPYSRWTRDYLALSGR